MIQTYSRVDGASEYVSVHCTTLRGCLVNIHYNHEHLEALMRMWNRKISIAEFHTVRAPITIHLRQVEPVELVKKKITAQGLRD